jgi:hypothetical protein
VLAVGRRRVTTLCSDSFECVCVCVYGAGPKLSGEGGRLGARCSVGREAGGRVWGGCSCSVREGKIWVLDPFIVRDLYYGMGLKFGFCLLETVF